MLTSGDLGSTWVNRPGLKHGLPSLNAYKGCPPALSPRLVSSFSGASEGGCVASGSAQSSAAHLLPSPLEWNCLCPARVGLCLFPEPQGLVCPAWLAGRQ